MRQAEARFAGVGDMQERIAQVATTVTSPSGEVTVVAGAGGTVTDLRLTAGAMHLEAGQLSAMIMKPMRQAVAGAVQQQEPGDVAPESAAWRVARKMSALQEQVENERDKALVRPGFRERVDELMRGQWREPVIVLRLGDTGLAFDVPGRRLDGTVKGKRLVRRFFWNIARGIGRAVVLVFLLANNPGGGGGSGGKGKREFHVKGPANAMALDLVDGLRRLDGPWLVCSPSCVAVVDTGSTYLDPADAPPPQIVWQARTPQAPELSFRKRTLTWPDGSSFTFPLHGRTEEQHLRKYVEFPDTIHWTGRS